MRPTGVCKIARAYLFAALLAVAHFFHPTRLLAEALPDDGKERLNHILLSPDFQPRHASSGFDFDIKDILSTVWEHFIDWNRHRSPMNLHLPEIPGMIWFFRGIAVLGDILLSAALFVWTYWMLFVFLILVYFVVRALNLLRPSIRKPFVTTDSSPTHTPTLSWEDLRKYLERGEIESVVRVARDWFRASFRQRYKISLDLTDREAEKLVPPEFTGRDSFRKTSRLFEELAFAAHSIRKDDVERLVGELRPQFENSKVTP